MPENKLNILLDNEVTKVINEEIHLILTESTLSKNASRFEIWGYSKKSEIIKKCILHIASFKIIAEYNHIEYGVISEGEKMSYFNFNCITNSKNYEDIKKDINTLIKTLKECDEGEFLKECLED